MKLHELASEILALQNAAYDADDAEFDQLQARFADCKLAMSEKLDNIARLIRQMELDAECLKAEEQRLKKRRESLESRIESLEYYVGNCLGAGVQYKTPLFSFTWRKSTAVEITGEVPEQYQRVTVETEPDKKAITRDIKAGASLPFATLKKKFTLTIK